MPLIETNKEHWLNLLNPYDLVSVTGTTIFAKAQRLEAIVSDHNKKYFASHSAMLKADAYHLSEADAIRGVIGKFGIDRYFSNHHQIRIYRATSFTDSDAAEMQIAMGAVEGEVNYSMRGILEYVPEMLSHWFGKDYVPKDRRGYFCSEWTSHLILCSNLPYIQSKKEEEISPSFQYEWMETTGKTLNYWRNPLIYDRGKYLISI